MRLPAKPKLGLGAEAAMVQKRPSEARVVFLVGAVQFVNIVDFMMVMPLGEAFARALHIPLSHVPMIGGSYTAAACISGLAGAFFLDRFDRRNALLVAMLGLFAGTLAGAFATGMSSLLAARMLAGCFGGPATSISLSMLSDAVPPQRRGKAMGAVMGAFAASSVLGVPLGLTLASRFDWRAPFWAVGGLGAVIGALVFLALPPMRGHLKVDETGGADEHTSARQSPGAITGLLKMLRGDILLSLLLSMVAFGAAFVLIPSIAPYLIVNLGYPRAQLPWLYMAGGAVSFVTTRIGGMLVDKLGSFRVGAVGTALVALVVVMSFGSETPKIPVAAGFVGFMLAMGLRNVSVTSLASKVPAPAERARFSSLQSAAQHLAAALGAGGSSLLLSELPDGGLMHMPRVAMVSAGFSLSVLPILFLLERNIRGRAQ